MNLIEMRPDQLRGAVAAKLPLLLPSGSYEYHGEHMPLGTDTLISEGLCRLIAEKTDAVVAMPLYFMPTMNWAAGIEDGDVDFSSDALYPFVKEYLSKLIGMGFDRIYTIIGHQGKGGVSGAMLNYAFRDIIGNIGSAKPAGWGGLREGESNPGGGFFNMVRVCDYDEFIDYSKLEIKERMPVGHGGRGETQLIMALCEGLTRTENLRKTDRRLPSWLDDVWQADASNGEFWINLCAETWAAYLTGGGG